MTPMVEYETQETRGPNKINVYIDSDVLRRMKGYAHIANDMEIGGYGFVEVHERSLHIYDIVLPHQEVASAGIEYDPMDVLTYAHEKDYPTTDARVNWHTHGRLGTAGWSKVDSDWIEEQGKQGTPWLLSLVTLADWSQLKMRLDFFEPTRYTVHDMVLIELMDQSLLQQLGNEVDEKVTVVTAPSWSKSTTSSVPIKTVRRRADKTEETFIGGVLVEKKNAKGEIVFSRKDDKPVVGGIDLDRDDVSEEDAARMLADIGLDLDDVLIKSEDEIDMEGQGDIEDEEDKIQEELVRELEEATPED